MNAIILIPRYFAFSKYVAYHHFFEKTNFNYSCIKFDEFNQLQAFKCLNQKINIAIFCVYLHPLKQRGHH